MQNLLDNKENVYFNNHLKEVGKKYLPLILVVQVILVPTHIFTTDFVDTTIRFSSLSIGLRLGTSLFFVICYLLFKKNLQLYLSVSFIVNAISDSYLVAISTEDFLPTHLVGLGIVFICYAILTIWKPIFYIASLVFSLVITIFFFYFLSDYSFLKVLKGGGVFILFIVIISVLINLIRYRAFKREFAAKLKINNQNEALQASEEELRQNLEELESAQNNLENQKNDLEKTLKKLKFTQNQLIQSEKLASLGKMTEGIAHEINNPLNFVSGGIQGIMSVLPNIGEAIDAYSKLKISEIKESDYSAEAVNAIEKIDLQETKESINDISLFLEDMQVGVDRISGIVNGLRLFANSENESLVKSDIHYCIDSALLAVTNKLSKISLSKNYDTSIKKIDCHPYQLTRAILSILSNAIHAVNEKENAEIKITTTKNKSSIQIDVSDNGEGIPKENIDKIFEPFFTTKAVGVGTGLGLSIAHGIVEKHGGKIMVHSELGKGSLFLIVLPTSEKDIIELE